MKTFKDLFPYQAEDANWLANRKRAALFHEMGTGKTWIALGAATKIAAKNILILAPKVMLGTWERETRDWGFRPEQLCITNYEQLIAKKFVLPFEPDLIIADEAHALKSWSAKRTRIFYQVIAKVCPYVWFLTGTPMTRSAEDLHPLLSFCTPGKFPKFSVWQSTYCNFKLVKRGGKTFPVFEGVKESMKGVLSNFLKEIAIRRRLKEVAPYLPKMLYSDIPVTSDKRIVAECLKIPLLTLSKSLEEGRISTHLQSLIRAIGVGKVKSATEFICEQFDNTPIVAFFLHTEVGLQLKAALEHQGKRVGIIYGAISSEDREAAIHLFQSGLLDVILLNTYAAGVGITLTKASHCLHVELPWSAAQYMQANARIDRIGQTATGLNCYNLIARGTTDEMVRAILNRKEKEMGELMESYG